MIDATVKFFGYNWIQLGNNVRIDAFSILTAAEGNLLKIGNHVHIASGSYLFASGGGITMEPFSGTSPRATILTATDDFTDGSFIGTQHPDEFRNVHRGPVILERHAIIGAGAIVMPGVKIGYGAIVGALSLVKHDVEPFTIVAGPDQRVIGRRNEDRLRELEAIFAEKHGR